MSKQRIERVFNEFYKADISRHDFDSNGLLGMSILKLIIEMHNGKIWAEIPGPRKGKYLLFLSA